MKRNPIRLIALIPAILIAVAHIGSAALIVHYGFEEGSGTTTADGANPGDGTATPNDIGSLRNSPTWVAGKVGSFALKFNGSNQDVLIDDSFAGGTLPTFEEDILNGASSATLAAWVNVTALPASHGEVIILRRNASSTEARAALRVMATGSLQIGVRSTDNSGDGKSLTSSTGLIGTNQWIHVASTIDVANDVMKLYVNGTLVSTSPVSDIFSTSAFPNTNSNAVLVGSNGGGGNYLNASIDDVRIYNNVLSDVQVAALAAIPEPSTLALAASGLCGLMLFARRLRGKRRD